MPATILDDVVFPDELVAVAARGRKRWATAIATNQGGFETRNGLRTQPLREYEIGMVPRTVAAWMAVDTLHDVVQGSLYGFLLRDPTNNACTTANGLMRPLPAALRGTLGTAGAGYGVPNYRLIKRGTSGARTLDRDIRKPVTTGLVLYRNGSPVTLGASAGNAAVDAVNGNIAFVADSSSAVTAVTVGATTQVTLSAALPGLAVSGRLYLAGLTGTHAADLNNLSHAITAISGGGSNVYTLSTNTAGRTITAAGTGFKYPQPSDTLTWAGDFRVPVRFKDDDIDWSMVMGHADTASRLVEGPSVLLVEVPLP